MSTNEVKPPMQTCAFCGAEWFMVHSCTESAKVRLRAVTGINLADALAEANKQIEEQQRTITELMLELCDVRAELERVKSQRRILAQ
jgi:DNA-directed RNA polymerase subunit L